jgi:hypothetical protein
MPLLPCLIIKTQPNKTGISMSEFTQSMIRAYGNWLPFRGDPTNLRIIQGKRRKIKSRTSYDTPLR